MATSLAPQNGAMGGPSHLVLHWSQRLRQWRSASRLLLILSTSASGGVQRASICKVLSSCDSGRLRRASTCRVCGACNSRGRGASACVGARCAGARRVCGACSDHVRSASASSGVPLAGTFPVRRTCTSRVRSASANGRVQCASVSRGCGARSSCVRSAGASGGIHCAISLPCPWHYHQPSTQCQRQVWCTLAPVPAVCVAPVSAVCAAFAPVAVYLALSVVPVMPASAVDAKLALEVVYIAPVLALSWRQHQMWTQRQGQWQDTSLSLPRSRRSRRS